jgi:hypothetical protein
MPKPDSLQGSLDLLVLKILSRRPGLHGYAIMSAIRNISGDVLRAEEGSLHPALHRMEEAGWIRARWNHQRRRPTGASVRADESWQRTTNGGGIALASGDFGCKPRLKDGLICHGGHASRTYFARIV